MFEIKKLQKLSYFMSEFYSTLQHFYPIIFYVSLSSHYAQETSQKWKHLNAIEPMEIHSIGAFLSRNGVVN